MVFLECPSQPTKRASRRPKVAPRQRQSASGGPQNLTERVPLLAKCPLANIRKTRLLRRK
eukprot:6164943-Pyramimonas_sp.AAC.1